MNIPDHEVEEEWRDDASLRDPHLHLPPLRRLPLVQTPNPPVAQVSDQPTLQIGIEIGGIDLPEKFMVVDDIKGRLQINAEEARPKGGLFLVETSDDLGCEWD